MPTSERKSHISLADGADIGFRLRFAQATNWGLRPSPLSLGPMAHQWRPPRVFSKPKKTKSLSCFFGFLNTLGGLGLNREAVKSPVETSKAEASGAPELAKGQEGAAPPPGRLAQARRNQCPLCPQRRPMMPTANAIFPAPAGGGSLPSWPILDSSTSAPTPNIRC